jgi:hypothetical protein
MCVNPVRHRHPFLVHITTITSTITITITITVIEAITVTVTSTSTTHLPNGEQEFEVMEIA